MDEGRPARLLLLLDPALNRRKVNLYPVRKLGTLLLAQRKPYSSNGWPRKAHNRRKKR